MHILVYKFAYHTCAASVKGLTKREEQEVACIKYMGSESISRHKKSTFEDTDGTYNQVIQLLSAMSCPKLLEGIESTTLRIDPALLLLAQAELGPGTAVRDASSDPQYDRMSDCGCAIVVPE